MTWTLLLALSLVTAASRVLPMALLPHPRGRAADVLQSLPAPLFAGLAALALVGDGSAPGLPAVLAGVGALLGSLRRSLGLALACGVAGFLVGQALVG
jgi:hypothetical protein